MHVSLTASLIRKTLDRQTSHPDSLHTQMNISSIVLKHTNNRNKMFQEKNCPLPNRLNKSSTLSFTEFAVIHCCKGAQLTTTYDNVDAPEDEETGQSQENCGDAKN
ncbi:hypothetical protein M513_03875 [Trichuris suis]|uniref:Uncharacterized protein n=1 Tax=Trichuris suis TaxID=68888 RepID=A0A085MDD8_9BILA|nr:hypothetical protein M513_03875 [Trichuris suis]